MPAGEAISPTLQQLTDLVSEHPAARKIVFAPQYQFGLALEDALVRQAGGWAGLSCTTIGRYARQVVRYQGVEVEGRLLPHGAASLLAAQAVESLPKAEKRSLLVEGRTSVEAGTARSLGRLFDAMRREGVSPATCRKAADDDRARARALAFARYEALLARCGYVDAADVLAAATAAIEQGRVGVEATVFAILDETRVTGLEARFLEALAGRGRRFYRIGVPGGERACPAGRAGCRLAALPRLGGAKEPPAPEETPRCVAAIGAAQEVRLVFRDILERGLSFDDVEIAYTSADPYLTLIDTLSESRGVPVSLSVGRPLAATRSGQALLGWLSWIQEGLEAPILIRLLRSGLLQLHRVQPKDKPWLPAHRAATLLASLRYRRGARGYREALKRKRSALEKEVKGQSDDRAAAALRQQLEEWKRLEQVMDALLTLVPEGRLSSDEFARRCREFLIRFGPIDRPEKERKDWTIDESARNRIIDQLMRLEAAEVPFQGRPRQLAAFLKELAEQGKVRAKRPEPGKVFAVPLESAGYAGRRHLYVVGLDASSVGSLVQERSALLDDREWRRLTEATGTSLASLRGGSEAAAWTLEQARARHAGPLTLTMRAYDVREGEERHPSPLFLRWGGKRAEEALDGEPQGFTSLGRGAATLGESEDWLAAYVASPPSREAAERFAAAHPGAARGRVAEERRASGQYTQFDGLLAEGEYPELDVLGTNRVVSASRLETLAKTPYIYFLRYVLGVKPLEEPALEEAVWLDPLRRGNVLHDAFERFLGALDGRRPAKGDEQKLLEVLAERLAEEKELLPPPSRFVEDDTLRQLQSDALVFLRAEICQNGDAVPHAFEFAFGSQDGEYPEPVRLKLGSGRVLRLRGRIDRIDRHPDGTFSIWDYKTGSSTSFNEADLLKNGEFLQWALYGIAVEDVLGGSVRQAGYFFTSFGEMGRRIAARPDRYRDDVAEVLDRLSEMSRTGTFPMNPGHESWSYKGYERLVPDREHRKEEIKGKRWPEDRPKPPHLS